MTIMCCDKCGKFFDPQSQGSSVVTIDIASDNPTEVTRKKYDLCSRCTIVLDNMPEYEKRHRLFTDDWNPIL